MGNLLNRLLGRGSSEVASTRRGKVHPEDENAASPEGVFLRSCMREILAQEPQLGRPAAFERAKAQLLEEIQRLGGPEATLLPLPKRRNLPLEGCFDIPGFTLEQTLLAEERLVQLGKTDFGATLEVYAEVVQELEGKGAAATPPGFSPSDDADFSRREASPLPTTLSGSSASGASWTGGSGRGVYEVTAESSAPLDPRRK